MIVKKRIPIWEPEEYRYEGAGGFIPHISAYLHEDEQERPAMIICPGGAYFLVSPTEGEIVARRFFEKGYQCFVVAYTTNIVVEFPLFDQSMKDLSRAIRYVRSCSGEFRVKPSEVYICGFSAGGHLCASVCDYFGEIEDENPKYTDISNRPDGAILSYPVITSGEKAHQGSFQFLAGADIYERTDAEARELLDRYSLEKHVSEHTPPCFLWHTVTDETVPVENTLLYEKALREKEIRHAVHLYSNGPHGLSVADEEWAPHTNFGEPYTADQIYMVNAALERGEMSVKEESAAGMKEFLKTLETGEPAAPAWPEVTSWPDLADEFFKNL